MSAALAAFHFLHPWVLLALLPLPLVAWWLDRRLRGDAAFKRLVDAALLPLLLAPGRRGRWLPLALLSACWLIGTLAFAGPTWERLPQPLTGGGGARVIALSLSDAMLAGDVKPNRLTRARYKIHDLLEASGDTRNALIGYAGEAFVVAPLTFDNATVTNLLGALNPSVMPVSGDAAAKAIVLGVKLLKQAGVHGGDILLVTSSAGDQVKAAARAALHAGVHVSVLAVGTAAGAPLVTPRGGWQTSASGKPVIAHLDAARLRAIAAAGGGRYQPLLVGSEADVDALRGHHHVSVDAKGRRHASAPRWRDRGPWLLLLLLPLVALTFRRGWLLAVPLVLVALPPASRAAGLPDVWHNANQQAAIALKEGKPKQAAKLARNPAWRASAQFRAGDYAAAAKTWATQASAQARYNQGNALAAQRKYQAAIAAYDKALKLDPKLSDASANRKAIEAWLKQHKPPKSNKSGQSGKSGKQKKSGQSQSSVNNSGQHHQKPSQNQAGKQGQQQQAKPNSKPNDKSGQQHQQSPSSARSSTPPAAASSTRRKPKPAPSASAQRKPQPAHAASTQVSQAQRAARMRAQQQAMKRRMDKALKGTPKPKVHVLGAAKPGDKQTKLPDKLRRELQRVPDDPGGLLRRKFMLEYQRRQQAGDRSP